MKSWLESQNSPTTSSRYTSPSPSFFSTRTPEPSEVIAPRFPLDHKNLGLDVLTCKEIINLRIKQNNVAIAEGMKRHALSYRKLLNKVKNQEQSWRAVNSMLKSLPEVTSHVTLLQNKLINFGTKLQHLEILHRALSAEQHVINMSIEDDQINTDLIRYREAMQEHVEKMRIRSRINQKSLALLAGSKDLNSDVPSTLDMSDNDWDRALRGEEVDTENKKSLKQKIRQQIVRPSDRILPQPTDYAHLIAPEPKTVEHRKTTPPFPPVNITQHGKRRTHREKISKQLERQAEELEQLEREVRQGADGDRKYNKTEHYQQNESFTLTRSRSPQKPKSKGLNRQKPIRPGNVMVPVSIIRPQSNDLSIPQFRMLDTRAPPATSTDNEHPAVHRTQWSGTLKSRKFPLADISSESPAGGNDDVMPSGPYHGMKLTEFMQSQHKKVRSDSVSTNKTSKTEVLL